MLRLAGAFNSVVMAAAGLPVVGSRIRSFIAPITYIGRRSGRTITLPVGYRLSGDTVTIRVGGCPIRRRGGATSSARARP